MRFGIIRGSAADSSSSDSDDSENKKKVKAGPEPLGRESYHEIETLLGYQFSDQMWLERALTHRSAQSKDGKNDYERLEFLGDAVFDLATAHLLLEHHPEAREGELSKMRAALVNTASLAEFAREIKLGRFVRLSRGELASGGAERNSILADVLEAIIGAIYREAGYDTARACVERIFGDRFKTVTPRDPKTELQEALHASGSDAPVYRLECVEGPEHAPVFISIVEVDGQVVGRGRGPTKKASQQTAADQALARVRGEDELDRSLLTGAAAETKQEV